MIRDGIQITAADLLRLHKQDLGLGEQDELVLYRTDHDGLGFTHYRYRQYHQGIKVEGGELLVHEQNGFVRTLNGKLVRGLLADIQPGVTQDKALQLALAYAPADRYMWEDESALAMLRRIKKDPGATFYPKPELVLADPSFEQKPGNFQLAWSMEVFAEAPLSKKQVLINAKNGALLGETELLCDNNTPGTAQTKYSGTRAIITDSISPDLYRLVETTRGGGIETYNMKKGTDYDLAVDFTDEDNHWNNVNAAQDEAATDVHWGSEMTFDYYQAVHGYSGIDGNNMPLIGYVHYDNNWSNARWTGDWALFGDGDGTSWKALTALDVVGHEFTHGVTGNNAKLKYQNESGALNESFSDVFGAAIEFWADTAQSDWLVGEDFIANGALRNMADPKAENNPDTYKGDNWATGSSDNGGVHTNSGVQNHWFFLLSDGGSGENDNNDTFSVAGLGIDKAAAIAFRNLRYYLVETSNYADAREGSLLAANDLYGACSTPVLETAKAWYAVGVGAEQIGNDLRMVEILGPTPFECGLADQEFIAVRLRYNGCVGDLVAGDKIPLSYQIDNGDVVWDTLTLNAPLVSGDTIDFTFSVPTTVFTNAGTFQLQCKTGLDTDVDLSNDGVAIQVERYVEQNVDMGLKTVSQPASNCFLAHESPAVDIGFFGCDSIAANEEITLFYSINGAAPVSETVQVPATLYRGESFKHTFSTSSDFSLKGAYSVDAWVQYGPDFLSGNDSLRSFRVINPFPLKAQTELRFEGGDASLDSIFIETRRETVAFISPEAKHTGANGFRITGGDVAKAYTNGEIQLPNTNNVWNINSAFRSKMCLCADLTNMSLAQVRFERRQSYSNQYLSTVGVNLPFFSALRVLANGDPISVTYKPVSYSSDPWFTHYLSLNDYLGSEVEICFQTHTGMNPAFDPSGNGDKVYLDNISIVGQTVAVTDLSESGAEWHVTPNPGSGAFVIAYKATEAQKLHIDVIDTYGRSVRSCNRRSARATIPSR
ncbi:MAG: M4 family metallopeptidase [Lewinellaceae bacterium]|nr:M4 family metallopeptidase [Lewinellaceae bacterium]